LGKKKKVGIIIIAFVLFYIFLIFSPDLFTIPPFVFTDKSEYSIGENVIVYGFSIQPHRYTSGCDSLLTTISNSSGQQFGTNTYICTQPVGYTLPMVFYSDVWDQKIIVGFEGFTEKREFVESDEYYLHYMNQKVPIKIVDSTS